MYNYPPNGAFPPPQGFAPPPGGGFPPPQGFGPGGGFPPPQGFGPGGGYPPPGPGGGFPPKGFAPQGFPPGPGGGFPPPQQQMMQNGYQPQGYPPNDAYGQTPQGYQGYNPNGSYGSPQGYAPNATFGQPQAQQLLTPAECDEAAKTLYGAMKGMGTNEKKLISVLGKYPPIQMNQIIKSYKSNYGKNLLDDVKSETGGNFGNLACALSMTIVEYDVKCIHDAIACIGTDDDCLMEILVGRTNNDMKKLCEEYKKKYGTELEDDVKGDTSGYVRRLYTVLLQGNRDETNQARDVEADVEALYRAGEGRSGTDEMGFISLLCNRPSSHLNNVFNRYQQKYSHTIEKAIEKEFSGDIEKALLKLVSSIRNMSEYIATQFEKSMKGIGTDDEKLIRLVVRFRAPSLIEPIKEAYKTKYGKTLGKRIKGETSGDYCKLLLACINEEGK